METGRHILSRKNTNNDECEHCLQVKEKLEFVFFHLFHDYIVSFSFNCQRQLIAVLRKIVFQTVLIKYVKGMVILPTQPRDIRKITEGGAGDYGSSSATALLREVAALIC